MCFRYIKFVASALIYMEKRFINTPLHFITLHQIKLHYIKLHCITLRNKQRSDKFIYMFTILHPYHLQTDPTTNLFFDFDTPGSQLDRRFSFKYHRNTTEINSILLLMRTPWKSLSLSGGFSAKENYTEVKAGRICDIF